MRKLLLGKKVILENLDKDIISIHSIKNFQNIREIAEKKQIPYFVHTDSKFFDNLNVNHQGIVAFLKNSDFHTNDFNEWYAKVMNSNRQYKLVLLLDGIKDIGNFGAIIRSCDCFGVDGIIIRETRQAPINDIVIKNSKGAIYNANILIVNNLSNVMEELKKLNFWTVATTIEGDQNYYDLSYDFNCCLIMGDESVGVSKRIIENADYNVTIPMQGFVNSLNVSVATGIFLSFIRYKS